MKAGFVSLIGKPNAGKSTLLNALIAEKLAIVSPKVQTTRHRIKAILTEPDKYQIVFSDTPGIIDAKYKLHQRMMSAVQGALEDADLILLMVDIEDSWEENNMLFESLHLKKPVIVVLNKVDTTNPQNVQKAIEYFSAQSYAKQVIPIAALQLFNVDILLSTIIENLPEGTPYFDGENISDLPTKFFVSEMIREKIYQLYGDEIPYHSTVLINEFKELEGLVRIQADIIVQRDTQKKIMIGEKGKMIKQVGILSREEIEKFLDSKVFLELIVKVRPKWRDNDLFLKSYGYN